MHRLKNSSGLKVALISLLLLGIAAQSYGQETIRGSEFLRQQREEFAAPDDYSDQRRVRLPWIQEYQYRTETNRFEWERQEHVLRVSPNTPGLRRAQSRLVKHYRSKRAMVETFYRNDRIEAAYRAWKDLYVSEQQLQHYTRLEATLADRLRIQQRQAQALSADYKEVLEAQERLNEVRILRYEQRLASRSLREQLGLDTTTVVAFNMVTPEQILLRISDSVDTYDPQVAEYHYERELIEREMALEKAEKWQLLDFLQVRYNGPQEELLEEQIQLRAGFVLPTSGTRNLKLEELRLEQEELQREQQVKQQKLAHRVAERRDMIRNSVRVYRRFAQMKDEELAQLASMAQAIARRQGTDPDLLLKINQSREEILLDKLLRREDIYSEYLEYLALTGQLFDESNQNYLEE